MPSGSRVRGRSAERAGPEVTRHRYANARLKAAADPSGNPSGVGIVGTTGFQQRAPARDFKSRIDSIRPRRPGGNRPSSRANSGSNLAGITFATGPQER